MKKLVRSVRENSSVCIVIVFYECGNYLYVKVVIGRICGVLFFFRNRWCNWSVFWNFVGELGCWIVCWVYRLVRKFWCWYWRKYWFWIWKDCFLNSFGCFVYISFGWRKWIGRSFGWVGIGILLLLWCVWRLVIYFWGNCVVKDFCWIEVIYWFGVVWLNRFW